MNQRTLVKEQRANEIILLRRNLHKNEIIRDNVFFSHELFLNQISYFAQKDNFSCGYRNLQMILSANVPYFHPTHPYFQQMSGMIGSSSYSAIASIHTIQTLMQISWLDGFDPEGSKHFNHNMSLNNNNNSSWIGCVDVSFLLNFLSIDNIVVQFNSKDGGGDNRCFLTRFLWKYYQNSNNTQNVRSGVDIQNVLTSASAAHIANFIQNPTPSRIIEYYASPIYLQWHGHSVTVIGIQRHGSKESNINKKKIFFEYDLIVLDPKPNKIMNANNNTNNYNTSVNCRKMNNRTQLPLTTIPIRNLPASSMQILITSITPLSLLDRYAHRRECKILHVCS